MSKIDGTLYKCDRCGETKFLSCADLQKDGGLSAQGIHKLSAGRQNNMHLCENCYFQFCDWFGEV